MNDEPLEAVEVSPAIVPELTPTKEGLEIEVGVDLDNDGKPDITITAIITNRWVQMGAMLVTVVGGVTKLLGWW